MHRLLVAALGCLISAAAHAQSLPLYVGTGGNAIYLSQFDTEAGTLSEAVAVAETPRPTFLWIHQGTKKLYSVSEMKRGSGAAIVAWNINPKSGKLEQLSSQDARGDSPCFVSVSPDGRYAAIANYGSGSTVLFGIKEDGSVGPFSGFVKHTGSSINPRRQSAPHAHISRFDPAGRRVVVADLGTDKVQLLDVTLRGTLRSSEPAEIDCPPGSGPRHLVFSPDGKYLLVLGELAGTITTFRYDPPSVAKIDTISTMAAGTPADAPRGSAEILFHPSGRFVYCSNRGPSEIACFRYVADTGKLKRTSAVSSGGVHPRNFRFTPDGKFMLVANQNTNNVVVFSIDAQTGQLTATGEELKVEKPMCLKFLQSGN